MMVRAKSFYWIIGSLIHESTFATSYQEHALKHQMWGKRAFSNNSLHSSEVSLTTSAEGSTGLIHVGTPGQILSVQFDTTFDGNMVVSASQTAVEGYRSDLSTTFNLINDLGMYIMPGISSDGAPSTESLFAEVANETYNIGGQLYDNVTFGILTESSQYNGIQAMPFGGSSGVIGLDRGSALMNGIKSQLRDWTCSFDLYRLWNNGTWILGESSKIKDIAWTDALGPTDLWLPWWWINVTALSAGNRRSPSITWTVALATTHESLVWPQQLIDWYFEAIPSSLWSSKFETYSYLCNETLPDFVFGIGNGTFTIPGTYMPYQKDETGTRCITLVTGDNSTDSAFYGYPFGTWWAQLGVLILDYENGRVGFANKTTPLPTFGTDSLSTCVLPCLL